jgi:hypothetical protein
MMPFHLLEMKSRSGSYKKILITPDELKSHGDYLRVNVGALKGLGLCPHDFTTLYLILFLRLKHPKNWLQKKSIHLQANAGSELLSLIPESFALNQWEKEKLQGLTSLSLFSFYNLKAIPESINRTMINWIQGRWKIELMDYIPIPRELLALQVKNTRCVTVITDPQQIDSLVFNVRDPLSFVLHDLMHADQFFNQMESQKGQLGFYRLIHTIYDRTELRQLLKKDSDFKKEFEYVTTDMNAYVIHLFKCFKSSIHRVDQNFFEKLLVWWNMNELEKSASHRINSPDFTLNDELILKTFFENNQEII